METKHYLAIVVYGFLALVGSATVKHFGWHDGLAIVAAIWLLMPQLRGE